MAAPFAGLRRNEGLGRSAHARRGLFLGGRPHRRQGVLFGRRGGERRRLAPTKHEHSSQRPPRRARVEDTSFTRSEDPCTSILTTLRPAQAGEGEALRAPSRSGKPAQAGGTGTEGEGSGRLRGSPRVYRSRKGRRVTRQKRKEVAASVPARTPRARAGVPARRGSLQKSVGDVGSQIPSRAAPQKGRRREQTGT